MRFILAALLLFFSSLPAFADDALLAGKWTRFPRDARMAYMTGAASGLRVFALSNPGTPMPEKIQIDQAVTNMDHLAADPLYARKPLAAAVYSAIMHAQDKGVHFVERGTVTRDPQFDYKILFDRPWLAPINLDILVPTEGPKPTFARSWFSTAQHQREFFIAGFGDMVARQCLDTFGDTPSGQKCLKPLIPIPQAVLLMEMDHIYRDPEYAAQPYDAVIRAALLKMNGGDWQATLPAK